MPIGKRLSALHRTAFAFLVSLGVGLGGYHAAEEDVFPSPKKSQTALSSSGTLGLAPAGDHVAPAKPLKRAPLKAAPFDISPSLTLRPLTVIGLATAACAIRTLGIHPFAANARAPPV